MRGAAVPMQLINGRADVVAGLCWVKKLAKQLRCRLILTGTCIAPHNPCPHSSIILSQGRQTQSQLAIGHTHSVSAATPWGVSLVCNPRYPINMYCTTLYKQVIPGLAHPRYCPVLWCRYARITQTLSQNTEGLEVEGEGNKI